MGRKKVIKEKLKRKPVPVSSTLDLKTKYDLYERSVQNPEHEVEFLSENFKKFRGRDAKILREDFCGTGFLMNEWVKQGNDYVAHGVDLDAEPIEIGLKRHFAKLSDSQKKRVHYHEKDVLNVELSPVDLAVAFNFSYLLFKQRKTLLDYFKKVRAGLKDDGVFFVDILGGPECQQVMEESTNHGDFTYYWDCKKFDPLTNDCVYGIHFKQRNQKKMKDVFTYSWRLYSVPEIVDLLNDAGFSNVHTYWEGDDDEDGGGDGDFTIQTEAENCEAWVTYIAALK